MRVSLALILLILAPSDLAFAQAAAAPPPEPPPRLEASAQLTFLDTRTRMRRDHMKYLTLINAIALIHQHQRMVKKWEHAGKVYEYIEVEPSNIAIANELCHQVLGRSLDELAPQTRRLLVAIKSMVEKVCSERNMTKTTRIHTETYSREFVFPCVSFVASTPTFLGPGPSNRSLTELHNGGV